MVDQLAAFDMSRNKGKGKEPLGSDLDDRARQFAEHYRGLRPNDRTKLHDAVRPGQAQVLRGAAERMVSIAVHNRDPDRLSDALFLLGASHAASDPRETIIVLVLIKAAAEKLGVDLAEVFDGVKGQTFPMFDFRLAEFLGGDMTRDLASMGYVEVEDPAPDQPVFQRTW